MGCEMIPGTRGRIHTTPRHSERLTQRKTHTEGGGRTTGGGGDAV